MAGVLFFIEKSIRTLFEPLMKNLSLKPHKFLHEKSQPVFIQADLKKKFFEKKIKLFQVQFDQSLCMLQQEQLDQQEQIFHLNFQLLFFEDQYFLIDFYFPLKNTRDKLTGC